MRGRAGPVVMGNQKPVLAGSHPVHEPGGPGAAARGPPPRGQSQLTLPYQTLLVQIFWSFTTSPVFGECQIFPFPA